MHFRASDFGHRTLPLLLCLLTSASAERPAGDALRPGNYTRAIEVQNRDRTYLVHVPPSYDGAKPFPAVLAFHGGGTNAESMAQFSGLDEKADTAGFIAVYPNGSGLLPRVLTWNAGNCCGYALKHQIDDVAFTRALLDDLVKAVQIDPRRIYATGMSNGAMMAYRLASELSDRIAAIAAVGGPMGTETCNPRRPVPVIHFHGTADEFAPFHGGVGKKSLSKTHFYSVDDSIRAWVQANECPSEAQTAELPDRADDGTKVSRRIYGPGKNDAEVVLILIEGGGHTWPGRQPRITSLGVSTRDISANDLLWEFFEKHPLVFSGGNAETHFRR
ncbi:MAG: hypothetical protein HYU43_02785 [Armatimonadetes bacterium]|nr:hypothetical protein [Planctomycetota bacterium]MBI2200847.1 hypothetical protein [Armatimonadota bacterium]